MYCICGKTEKVDVFMIECDCCDRWFHGKCVGQTKNREGKKWWCPLCYPFWRGVWKKGTETVEQRVLPSSPLVVSDEETRNQVLVDSALGVPAVMKKEEKFDAFLNEPTGEIEEKKEMDPSTKENEVSPWKVPCAGSIVVRRRWRVTKLSFKKKF